MKSAILWSAIFILVGSHHLFAADPERRFGLILSTDAYPQKTPKEVLTSAVKAIEKGRVDYLAAFLMDSGYVDEQLRNTYAQFELKAVAEVEKEGLRARGATEKQIKDRIRDLAVQANETYFLQRIQNKLLDDPEILKDFKKLLREGDLTEAGDTAEVKHKDVTDKKLFLKKVGDRWMIENRVE